MELLQHGLDGIRHRQTQVGGIDTPDITLPESISINQY